MAAKDLTAIGLEILQTARNELYLNLPYLDVALCSLDFQPGGGVTLSLATDGETLYYDGSFLSERYLRSRTAVDRAYLHVLLHCMLRHLWKKRGRVAELWDLACDVAVESILDELDYPCLAGGFVPAKQKFYGECRAEMPVLTAEGIYRHLLRLDLPEYEVARLQRTFLVDDHGLWDPDQQDQEQQKQREQKWQGVSEKTQTGLETVLAGKATGGEAVLEQIQVANRDDVDYRTFLRRFAVPREVMAVDGDAFDWQHYSIETHEVLGYWAGSGGEVNASDIPTMGSFGDMEVFEIGDNQISISQQGNITYNGKEYKGMMVFNNDNGQVGHAVVITGTYLNPNTGKTQIKYWDEANQMPGKVDIGAWSTIYAVGEVGSYSAGGSIF